MEFTHDHRLVTYGTLAPGRVNHGQLANLEGVWSTGKIKGRLMDEGWGAAFGCPGIVLDPAGESVDVHVFESEGLPDFWPLLDAFEGDGYQRVVVEVETENGTITGQVYELAAEQS